MIFLKKRKIIKKKIKIIQSKNKIIKKYLNKNN